MSALTGILAGASGFAVTALGGALSAVGTLVDSIIVLSLAVFMAIDRDGILRLGLDLTPPDRREDALMFRRSVGSAAAGFIRSQLILGALYGVWAFVVSVVFGLPFAPATAFLVGLIMAIPIYGPYVSWLPPVFVALLVRPEIALVVAIVMLVGWFIDENILAPLVRADSLQLHPIIVTFAFLLGAQLAGAIGAIVAIPLAAVVQAFAVKYFERYRMQRGWPPMGAEPSVPAPAPSAVAGDVPEAGADGASQPDAMPQGHDKFGDGGATRSSDIPETRPRVPRRLGCDGHVVTMTRARRAAREHVLGRPRRRRARSFASFYGRRQACRPPRDASPRVRDTPFPG